MAENEDQKIKITFDTNAGKAAQDTSKLGAALDSTEKSTKKATKTTKDLGGGLEDLGGPVGGAVSGMKSMLKQMWLIVANPLGAVLVAIVGALALLFKAFTSTNDGADKLEQALAGLGAIVDVLRDRFLKLMSLDFKGAFSGVGDEISKEFKNAAKLAEALQQVEDATRNLGVSRAKLNRDLASSKELITDENASYVDKKKAIDAVRLAEGKQTDQELANAVKKLNSIKAKNALSDTSDEDLQKQADAESAVFKLQEEQSTNKRSLNRLDKKADNEEKSRLKEITDAKTAAYKERLAKQKEAHKLELEQQKKQADDLKALLKEKTDAEQSLIKFNQDLADKTEEQKLARQKERALQEIEALKQKGIDIEEITRLNAEKFATLEKELSDKRAEEKKIVDQKIIDDKKVADDKAIEAAKVQADKEIQIQKDKLEQERAIENAKLGLLGSVAELARQIFGKNRAVQKAALITSNAVGLAEVGINTVRAITADNAASPLTLGAPWSIIHGAQGAIGAASIIASTAKGLKELGGGSAGASPDFGGYGARTAARPSVSFNNTAENQIGQSVAKTQAEQPPLKVFVSESDITNSQKNVQVLVKNNSF